MSSKVVSSSVEVPHESGVQYSTVSSLQFRFNQGAHQTVIIRTRFLADSRKWNCHRSPLTACRADYLQTGTRDGGLRVGVRSGGREWCLDVGGGETEGLQTGLEAVGGEEFSLLDRREEFREHLHVDIM